MGIGYGLVKGLTPLIQGRERGLREREERKRRLTEEAMERQIHEANLENLQLLQAQRRRAESEATAGTQRRLRAAEVLRRMTGNEDLTELPDEEVVAIGTERLRNRGKAETPRNIDPLSPQGIRASVEKERAVGAARPTTGGAAMLGAIKENRTKLGVIDNALSQLAERPEGVGLKGLVPDIALQRLDPEGVNLRSNIADIGSMVIHDRSGAAVTVREMPRLSPFIPKSSDTPEKVRANLQRMREILEEETRFMEQARGGEGIGETRAVPTVTPTAATRPTPATKNPNNPVRRGLIQ